MLKVRQQLRKKYDRIQKKIVNIKLKEKSQEY
jgi:hypothetical protein